jgi:TolB-like protein/Tfp pilus assembly protein PilF
MIYRFSDCEFDAERRELRRSGVVVAMEPQVFDLLAFLLVHPDRLVSKDEINAAVWGGRIVSDAALSSRMNSLRQAIGDDGKTQSMIRTVHGRGFRFVAAVSRDMAPSLSPAGLQKSRERPTVAVLPFENLSGDAKDDFFADGVTADIVATLARHRWLSVVARNTMAQLKMRSLGIADVARETGADYVVEGSVRRFGDRVRVNVQLIDVQSGNCTWAERYDRESRDIFDVQDDITQTVSARIEPEIGIEERRRIVSATGSRDLKAWEYYHLGVWHFFRFTGPDNCRAQELLQKARELDPGFGDAHAWWAYATVLGTVYWDTVPASELLDEALAATQRALETDGQNAVFYALNARVQLARGEYESAIEGNKIAVELNPSLASAHCGFADSLTYLGRYDEAIERFGKAIALSSNDPQRWAFFTYGALALILKQDFESAIEWTERAAAIPNHQYWTLAHRAVALAYLGRDEEARHALKEAIARQPNLSIGFARQKMYFLKQSSQLEFYLEGLKRAGAPVDMKRREP